MKQPGAMSGLAERLPSLEAGTSIADVLVIGAGSQLHDQIPWALAEIGYRSDMINITDSATLTADDAEIIKARYKAVIISGSGRFVNKPDAPHIPPELTDGSTPLVGICYGGQAIAKNNGGVVGKFIRDDQEIVEFGRREITVSPDSIAFRGLRNVTVLMSHGESILELPPDAEVIGNSNGITAAFEMFNSTVLALQFHPEAPETDEGKNILKRFLQESAQIEPEAGYGIDQALLKYLAEEEAKIAEQLEAGNEITGFVSGGVDSSGVAAMVAKIAEQLGRTGQVTFYYVDSGAMRIEDKKVIEMLKSAGIPVQQIDASQRFFHDIVELTDELTDKPFLVGPLTETSDPDLKRRINGKVFLDIAEKIMQERRLERTAEQRLVMGTNGADFVESGGHGGSRHKNHHNVSPETKRWRAEGRIIEPFLGLFKRHVRMAARGYGLSEELAGRQPFPGPAETIRIIDNHNGQLEWPDDRYEIQASIDHIISKVAGERVRGHYVPLTVSGSGGDEGNNRHCLILEGPPAWQLLHDTGQSVTDQIEQICRVLYTSVPVDRSHISGAKLRTNEDHVAELVALEEIKRQIAEETGIDMLLSQHFVASLGFDLDGNDNPTLALRCFITGSKLEEMAVRRGSDGDETFLLGVAAIPGIHLPLEGFEQVISVLHIAAGKLGRRLVYDLTDKPPGMVEFQ